MNPKNKFLSNNINAETLKGGLSFGSKFFNNPKPPSQLGSGWTPISVPKTPVSSAQSNFTNQFGKTYNAGATNTNETKINSQAGKDFIKNQLGGDSPIQTGQDGTTPTPTLSPVEKSRQEYIDAMKKYTDYSNQLNQSITDAGHRVQPMTAIGGEQRALQEQYGNTLQTLQSGANLAKENYGMIKEENKPQTFELGEGQARYQYNPVTGKTEMVASRAKTYQPTTGDSNLSNKQYTALNQITTKFQADPIINQSVKGNTASAIADQIIANPNSATNQLKSLYTLVKNLDPDSAVREGELTLANQTQSYLQQFGNTLARITSGRVVSPDAAVALAQATKELMGAWNDTASKRQQQYISQSNVLGLSDSFSTYIAGSNLGYNTPQANTGSGGGTGDPLGIR